MLLRLCFLFAVAIAILAGRFAHAGVVSVSAGDRHTCALSSSGAVRCWGKGDSGQTGDPRLHPYNDDTTAMPLLATDAYQVVAGRDLTCFLSRTQGLECVGGNERGQLGSRGMRRTAHPVLVSGFSAGLTSVVLGDAHACALDRQGGVECWGSGEQGQLGTAERDGTPPSGQQAGTVARTDPAHVIGLASGIMKVASGSVHSCVVTSVGGVKCWGGNSFGQLGIGSHLLRVSPTDVPGLSRGVAQIALGFSHTCALLRSGAVDCWGADSHGQLGDGDDEERLSPHAVKTLAPGTSQLVAGAYHTCALSRDGAVRCWGQNDSGQLGDGTTDGRALPGAPVTLPARATQIAAGGAHTCALLATGALYCWGSNRDGQLGQAGGGVATRPAAVPFPFPVAQPVDRAGRTQL